MRPRAVVYTHLLPAAHIADAVWAAYHSLSTLVTVMLLLHERGAQPTLGATVQAMSYRFALHAALAALTKRMQGGGSGLGHASIAPPLCTD